jgi:hypothetical protein
MDDYNFFRDRWTPGTCDWVLNHDSFSQWLEDPAQYSRILWINGDPASGKSTLSSFIINHVIEKDLLCHYVFIRFASQKKRNLGMILKSLACQLTHSIPEYAFKLSQLAQANTDLQMADFRNIWHLLYKQGLLKLTTQRPIYLVLDGLDESEAPGSMIGLLSDLQAATIPLRVLVVSRKTHEISSALQQLGRDILVDTMHLDANRDDFRYYIELEMDLDDDSLFRDYVTQ